MKSSLSEPPGSLLTSPLELVIPMCPTIPGALSDPVVFWVVSMGIFYPKQEKQVEK